jgi:hypothetical protein
MRKFLFAALGGIVLATGTMVATPADAEAYARKSNGGTMVVTTNRTTYVTLKDRTPRYGKAIVLLQKKPGPQKCRVNRITFTRAGSRYYVGPFEKWARTYTRAGAWRFPNNGYKRDSSIQVSINTNGRCVVGVAIK